MDLSKNILDEKDILKLTIHRLNEIYGDSADTPQRKNDVFFILINSAIYYENSENYSAAASLYFYAGYYLFMWLTPPGSYELSNYYLDKALSLDPDNKEALEWKPVFEEGN